MVWELVHQKGCVRVDTDPPGGGGMVILELKSVLIGGNVTLLRKLTGPWEEEIEEASQKKPARRLVMGAGGRELSEINAV